MSRIPSPLKPGERPRGTADRPCLEVPNKTAERARKLLAKRNLLDPNVALRGEGGWLLLPLLRDLDKRELETLQKELGQQLFLSHKAFPPRVRPSRTLEQAVAGKLPARLLPDLPRSYDIIGDIAVVELRLGLAEHEAVLAEGVLRINKNVRVVMAKTGEVSGKERIRPVRYLAGENRTQTIHKESGCRFKVDIAKAYFSPRLSHEHERVVQMVRPGECVADLFAGVGPFSIMIAKKVENVIVNAVDANSDAVKLLEENVKLNKPKGSLKIWPGDARTVVEQHLAETASRVIMNYPSGAKSFVETACKALQKGGGMIHYYTFADGLNCEDRAVKEFEHALEGTLWSMKKMMGAHRVRGVGPMKWQVVVDALVSPN